MVRSIQGRHFGYRALEFPWNFEETHANESGEWCKVYNIVCKQPSIVWSVQCCSSSVTACIIIHRIHYKTFLPLFPPSIINQSPIEQVQNHTEELSRDMKQLQTKMVSTKWNVSGIVCSNQNTAWSCVLHSHSHSSPLHPTIPLPTDWVDGKKQSHGAAPGEAGWEAEHPLGPRGSMYIGSSRNRNCNFIRSSTLNIISVCP